MWNLNKTRSLGQRPGHRTSGVITGGKKTIQKETDLISTRWIPSSTPTQRSHTNTHVTTELFRVPKDRTSRYHHACFWLEVIQWMNTVPSANNRQWPNVVLAFSASCDSSRASFVFLKKKRKERWNWYLTDDSRMETVAFYYDLFVEEFLHVCRCCFDAKLLRMQCVTVKRFIPNRGL